MRRFLLVCVVLALAGCASMTPPGMNRPDLSKVTIGMTATDVKTAIGPPQGVNYTTTAAGTRQQWIYTEYSFLYRTLVPVAYLYFDDGVLVGIQN